MKNKLQMGQACLVSNFSEEIALTFEHDNTYQFLFTDSKGDHMVRYIHPDGHDGVISWKYAVAAPQNNNNTVDTSTNEKRMLTDGMFTL